MADTPKSSQFNNEYVLGLIDDYRASGSERKLNQALLEMEGLMSRFYRARYVLPDQVIADLTQKALADIAKIIQAGKHLDGNLGRWCCVIARYAESMWRRGKRSEPSTPGFGEDPFLFISNNYATQPEERPINSEAQKQAAAALAAATRALHTLAPNDRACVHLHYYQGQPEKEAALQLGISVEKFRERLARGLATLQAWARQNPQLALDEDQYAALASVNTGKLFNDPPPRPAGYRAPTAKGRATRRQRDAARRNVNSSEPRP